MLTKICTALKIKLFLKILHFLCSLSVHVGIRHSCFVLVSDIKVFCYKRQVVPFNQYYIIIAGLLLLLIIIIIINIIIIIIIIIIINISLSLLLLLFGIFLSAGTKPAVNELTINNSLMTLVVP